MLEKMWQQGELLSRKASTLRTAIALDFGFTGCNARKCWKKHSMTKNCLATTYYGKILDHKNIHVNRISMLIIVTTYLKHV